MVCHPLRGLDCLAGWLPRARLRFTLGFMLSPASRAIIGRLFFQRTFRLRYIITQTKMAARLQAYGAILLALGPALRQAVDAPGHRASQSYPSALSLQILHSPCGAPARRKAESRNGASTPSIHHSDRLMPAHAV